MRTTLRRRDVLAGALLASLAPFSAQASTASREFRILRGGSDIGRHRLDAVLTPDGFEIRIGIDIAVKVLGLAAYRYTLDNTEIWQAGRIVSVRSDVNDDGNRHFAQIAQGADGLEIDGSAYSGPARGEAVTTSYYTPAFLDRRPWISTQSGQALSISASPEGGGRWRIGGGLSTLLIYDDSGEWVGCEFDARGTSARYEPIGGSGGIATLWASA